MLSVISLSAALCHAQEAQRATVSAALNMTALQPGQQAVVAVVLDVKSGFHARSHTPKGENLIPTQVTAESTAAITTYEAVYPAGKDEFYPKLGPLNIYSGETIFYVPIQVRAQALPGPIKIGGTTGSMIDPVAVV